MRLNWNLPVRSQILGLSLLLSHLGVEALEWRGPKATGVGTQSEEAALVTPGISPRPTVVAELVKRDAWPVSYCGFVGGLMSLGVTCSTRSSCVWNTDYYIVGCCATASKACVFYTSCIDINSPVTAADDPLVYTCRGTKTCFQNQYPSNYHQWGCGYNATFIALTYINMSTDAATIQQTFMGNKDLIPVTTANVTHFVTVTATAGAGGLSTYNGPGTGTIVGAAIGGSLILVLGALLLACIVFQRRKPAQVENSQPPPVISSPVPIQQASPNMSTGIVHPQSQIYGFQTAAPYYTKDQFPPAPSTSPPNTYSASHSSFLSDGSPNPYFYPQGMVPTGGNDTAYRSHVPLTTPTEMPLSPTMGEMDGMSPNEGHQKPVTVQDGNVPETR